MEDGILMGVGPYSEEPPGSDVALKVVSGWGSRCRSGQDSIAAGDTNVMALFGRTMAPGTVRSLTGRVLADAAPDQKQRAGL